MFKKLIILALVGCLLLCLSACKKEADSDNVTSTVSVTESKVENSNDETVSETKSEISSSTDASEASSTTSSTSSVTETSSSTSTTSTATAEPTYLKGTYSAWVESKNDFSDYARFDITFSKDGTANYKVVYYKAFDKNTITEDEKEALNTSIKNGEFTYYYTKGIKAIAFNWPSCGVRPASNIDEVFEQRLMGETYHYNDTIVVCSDFAKDASAIETMDSESQNFTHVFYPDSGKITTEGASIFTELVLNEDNTITINGQNVPITDSFTKYMQNK